MIYKGRKKRTMKTIKKYAIALWCNLKGYYDIIAFDNKRVLNNFVKEYKGLFEDMEQEKITFEEFSICINAMMQEFENNFYHSELEIFRRDIEEDNNGQKFITIYNNSARQKFIISDFLDYGY
jgi:hypothetical protein